ncbi:MAG: YncE family protein [Bacteroides sp.]|nr:YncE family protein [Bacteroides sp.]
MTSLCHKVKPLIHHWLLIFAATALAVTAAAAEPADDEPLKRGSHTRLGARYISTDGTLEITVAGKKQYYNPSDTSTRDRDILSPKSVNIHPSGRKFYVNSLEGGRTVVYDMATMRKTATISHRICQTHRKLWIDDGGLFKFTHYTDRADVNTFMGRPVESAFSHHGRYLWIPYYRRSFDINAQDPSAIAVVDTSCDSIIRLFPTGALPKMIAASPDGRYIAVAHWGENTVGIIEISSPDPTLWRYRTCITIDHKLKLDFSLTDPVDRDNGSGLALRGTVFTPDNRYVLIGCMGGGGIAVIDLASMKYLGKIYGMMPNIRHLTISGDYLYLSANRSGHIQRMPLRSIYEAIGNISNRAVTLDGWQTAKVDKGARTITVTPDGRYVIAACNSASTVVIVDTRTMKRIATLPADSFPVGMDLSADGSLLFVTSQGRKDYTFAGNCVTIYRLKYLSQD